MINRLIVFFNTRLYLPFTILYLNVLNFKNKILWLFSSNKILKKSTGISKKVVLIALFQKGELRADLKRFIKILMLKGFSIFGVNTQKLIEEEITIFDDYIERKNYGQDFGSYKLGFLELFKRNNNNLEKLLMINDSIYFSSNDLEKFVDDLLDDEYDVIGATENFEVSHHLGSFCISISSKIFNGKYFRKFWNSFSLTNMRPTNIKKGEMGLSKALFKAMPSQKSFKVLYNSKRALSFLESNTHLLNKFNSMSRRSDLTPWKRPSGQEVINFIRKRLSSKSQLSAMGFISDEWKSSKSDINLDMSIDLDVAGDEYGYIDGYENFKDFFESYNIKVSDEEIKTAIKFTILNAYREGSQIHQNFIWNYLMGCPIFKNDSVYRGMMNMEDVINLKTYMNPKDFEEYSEILLSKSFGRDVYVGWRLYAFVAGYI